MPPVCCRPSCESDGALTLTFDILKAENRGSAVLAVEHSTDLGDLDAWLGATIPTPNNDVIFVVTPEGGTMDKVVATITALQQTEETSSLAASRHQVRVTRSSVYDSSDCRDRCFLLHKDLGPLVW